MITKEQRLMKLSQSSEAIQGLYCSLESARFLSALSKKFNLPAGGDHVDLIGDVMLGFYPKSELPKLFREMAHIPDQKALTLADELKSFLSPVPETQTTKSQEPEEKPAPIAQELKHEVPQKKPIIPEAKADLKERLRLQPEGAKQASAMVQPLTKTDVMNSLSPKRTMAGDMEAARGKGTLTQPPEKETRSTVQQTVATGSQTKDVPPPAQPQEQKAPIPQSPGTSPIKRTNATPQGGGNTPQPLQQNGGGTIPSKTP